MDPRSMQVVTAAFEAAWWLDERLGEWLFEPSATDTLTLSAPGNVTPEMGLELLDVADAIRPHPEVVAYLEEGDGAEVLEELAVSEKRQRGKEYVSTVKTQG